MARPKGEGISPGIPPEAGRKTPPNTKSRKQVRQAFGPDGVTHDSSWRDVPRKLGAFGPDTGIVTVLLEQKRPTISESDPLRAVRLEMYSPDPTEKLIALVKAYAGSPSVDALAVLSNPTLRKKRRVNTADIDHQREEALRQKLKSRINNNVYSRIQEGLGLESRTQAEEVFEKQRQIANEAIEGHINVVFPDVPQAQLKRQVRVRQTPADLLELALRVDHPETDKRTDRTLAYEIQRQAVDTAIGLHDERFLDKTVGDKLNQFSTMLDEQFLAGEVGKEETLEVYALFDNTANSIAADDPLFFAPPTVDAPEGKHYKKITLPVQKTKPVSGAEKGANVIVIANEKNLGNVRRKSVRRAQDRVADGGDDIIKPEEVEDRQRVKIVVVGDQKLADDVALDVFALATNNENHKYFYNKDDQARVYVNEKDEPLGIPIPNKDRLRTSIRGAPGSSDNVNYVKLEIPFNDSSTFKVTVQDLRSFINEMFEVGEYDEVLGKYLGAAWELYAIQRELPSVLNDRGDIYFLKEVYPGLEQPYEHSRANPYPTLEAKAVELRRRKTVHIESRTPVAA